MDGTESSKVWPQYNQSQEIWWTTIQFYRDIDLGMVRERNAHIKAKKLV